MFNSAVNSPLLCRCIASFGSWGLVHSESGILRKITIAFGKGAFFSFLKVCKMFAKCWIFLVHFFSSRFYKNFSWEVLSFKLTCWCFLGDFLKFFKINFVTKIDKVQIFKKHHITPFCIKQDQKRKIFKGDYVFEIFWYLLK